MDDEPDREWRGRIRGLLYGLRVGGPVDAEALDRRVEMVLRRRRFGDDPEETYSAAVAALRSGAPLAERGQDEDAVRGALTGIVRGLDDRRPWPPVAFREQDVERWAELRTTPVVGRIPRSMKNVEAAFGLSARPVDEGSDQVEVLVVEMAGGAAVALRSARVGGALVVEVQSTAEPSRTRAEIAEATSLTVDPP